MLKANPTLGYGATMQQWVEVMCDEAALVHWTQETADLPSWEQAHARIQQEGRRSKVNHPSPAHSAYEIEQPAIRRTRERHRS